jgi:hypothetical protein
MSVGKGYRLAEFLIGTRQEVYVMLALEIVPVWLYELAQWRWLAVPCAEGLDGSTHFLTRTLPRVRTEMTRSSPRAGSMRRRRSR